MGESMTKTSDEIEKLEERINELKVKEAVIRGDKAESKYVYASKAGFRVATELLSAVIVGAALGYFLDRLLGTHPWLMVVMMLFGGGAGFLNVYRFVKSEEEKQKE